MRILILWLLALTTLSHAEGPRQWTLDDVKKIALENNPDLKSARANLEAARATIGEAVSGYLPHLDLSAKFEQTTLPSPSAGATSQVGLSLPYKAATASLSQILFDFGKNLSLINANRAGSGQAEQDALALRNAVVLAVHKAFYDVQASTHLLDVAKKGLEKFDETYRRTEVLVRTGAKPQFDLTQARVEVAKAKLAVTDAQNSVDLARIALLDLMGMRDPVDFTLAENAASTPTESVQSAQLNLEHLISKALEARPEMKRQEFALQSARYQLAGEVRSYLPTISLQGFYSKYLPDYPPQLNDSWGVALVGTWHVFQGMETTFRVGELSARMDRQEALTEKDRLSIMAEVTRAYKDLSRSEDKLQVAHEQLEASQENLRLAQKRYDASVATILELLTAETSLLNAEATDVKSRYEHEIALATLKRVVNAPLEGT